jgi:hypothetical protein
MKAALSAWIILVCSNLWAEQTVTEREFERIADAIFIIEGGTNARVPYGIVSIKVRDAVHARKICLNTIRNNHERWRKSGQKGKFLDFLADRYCPKAGDPVGNRNWKRNIRFVLNNKAQKAKGTS